MRPVTRMLVRVSRWLDACMCTCISGSRRKSAPRWAASVSGGETGDGGSGRDSARKDANRQAAAAGGDARSLGSPVWVGVGGERVNGCGAAALMSALRRPCGSLNACGNVISGCTRAMDSMFTRSVSYGVVRVELVKVSQR